VLDYASDKEFVGFRLQDIWKFAQKSDFFAEVRCGSQFAKKAVVLMTTDGLMW
jgi:hypothetical protein